MKTDNVIAGLRILRVYTEEPYAISIGWNATIVFRVRYEDVSTADCRSLQLGWFKNDNGYWATFT